MWKIQDKSYSFTPQRRKENSIFLKKGMANRLRSYLHFNKQVLNTYLPSLETLTIHLDN